VDSEKVEDEGKPQRRLIPFSLLLQTNNFGDWSSVLGRRTLYLDLWRWTERRATEKAEKVQDRLPTQNFGGKL